jgi:glyoxylase-like metal-dependent hydrolase (beta-lactamase superfamily II)
MDFKQQTDIIELSQNFYVIKGDNKARFPFSNAFLITGNQTVIIDTGIGNEKLRQIDEMIRIDRVIISHPHPDHISGFAILKDRHLMLPKETTDAANDLVELGIRYTGSQKNGVRWAKFVAEALGIEPLRDPDSRYKNGDILDFGSVKLEAIHAPGHLNDHYCFFDHVSKTLLTTDIDFSSFGPWYGNPECTIEPFINSIHKVMALPYQRVCSSHKPPIEKDAAKAFHLFLDMFDHQRELILRLCEKPTTLDQMIKASPFYGNKLKGTIIQDVFEKNMIKKNLELLVRDGRVVSENNTYLKAGK